MTKEEISKLAEKYSEHLCPESGYTSSEQWESDKYFSKEEAKSTLTWLEKDYFILKKKDPRKTYQYYKTNLHQLLKAGLKDNDPDVALCRGVLAVLEDLFGKENLI